MDFLNVKVCTFSSINLSYFVINFIINYNLINKIIVNFVTTYYSKYYYFINLKFNCFHFSVCYEHFLLYIFN